MAKKNKAVESNRVESNRVYPIKVRLIKPNPANEDKVRFNDIELYTYKDTEIPNAETFMKLTPMASYLIVKSELKESEVEVIESDSE